jgi:homogentisate phytyltransferase/homogentisate geranylgeranyltransferase
MNDFSQQGLSTFSISWFYAFWKFSRPHTIIGTTLSVLGIYLLTLGVTSTSFSVVHLGQIFITWLACIAGNIYIVGLNQLEDVEIDKVNKPHLPLAAGEFTREQGNLIVIAAGILALFVASFSSIYLLAMVGISLLIGTAYSLPPIRLKQFPFWAAVCIFSVRGTIVNLGLFLHFSWLFKSSQNITPEVWALTGFILVFTFAIAIFKDIPDMEGDKLYNITTFTLQLGKEKVFNLALWVLTVCYVGIMVGGLFNLTDVNTIFILITHIIPLTWMWLKSRTVNLENKGEIANFYQFIWKLFFVEYLIFPISSILA